MYFIEHLSGNLHPTDPVAQGMKTGRWYSNKRYNRPSSATYPRYPGQATLYNLGEQYLLGTMKQKSKDVRRHYVGISLGTL